MLGDKYGVGGIGRMGVLCYVVSVGCYLWIGLVGKLRWGRLGCFGRLSHKLLDVPFFSLMTCVLNGLFLNH